MLKNNIIGYVYKITNLINSKVYIGQTINFDKRIKQHINDSKKDKPRSIIACAIKKYGLQNFIFEKISTCFSLRQLNFKESIFILHYKKLNLCYNIEKRASKRNISLSLSEKAKRFRNSEEGKKLCSINGKKNRGKKRGKFLGVRFHIQKKCYIANINFNNKTIYLGSFLNELDAVYCRDYYSLQYFKDEAVLNFPELKEKYLKNEINFQKLEKNTRISKNKKSDCDIVGITIRNKRNKKFVVALKNIPRKSFFTLEEAKKYLFAYKSI